MDKRILIGIGVLLVAHFLWLACYVLPAYASPDADGYFAQAELIAHKGRVTFEAESPVQLIGFHWLEKPDGSYISRYPPGLPIVLAVVWKLLGQWAIFYVNPLLATLTVLLLFLLVRPYAGDKLALAAALIYAVNPMADYHAVHADAHTASTFFLVAGFWLLDAWVHDGGWWRALGAGVLLGWVPSVRYAEAVAAVGVAVFVLLQWDKVKGRGRELALLVGGAAAPVLLLAAYNRAHFGAFWHTAYALTGEQQIGLRHLLTNWHPYLTTLVASGLGLFLAIGIAGLAGMIAVPETRAFGAGLAAVILAVTAVYSGAYFTATIRYLLPTLPFYVVPAVWLFRQIPQRAVAAAALGALLTVHLAYSLPAATTQLARQREASGRAAATLAWMTAHVPAGSIVLADQRIHQCVNFTGRWLLADTMFVMGERDPGAMFDGTEDQPGPGQPNKGARLRARYDGLSGPARTRAVFGDLRAWAGSTHELYWIGDSRQIERLQWMADGIVGFEPAGKIELAASPLMPPGMMAPPGMPFPTKGMRKGGMRPGGGMGAPMGGPGAGPSGTLEVFRLR